MIKKLAAVGVGAAMFLAAAVPAFASTSITNVAGVTNDVTTYANTGWNTITSVFGGLFGNSIHTGGAGAGSQVTNQVNTNSVSNCLCESSATIHNSATVLNVVNTAANTGHNEIVSGDFGSEFGSLNSIISGGALSQAAVTNVVNTNVVGF